jgi:hypothetical protein
VQARGGEAGQSMVDQRRAWASMRLHEQGALRSHAQLPLCRRHYAQQWNLTPSMAEPVVYPAPRSGGVMRATCHTWARLLGRRQQRWACHAKRLLAGTRQQALDGGCDLPPCPPTILASLPLTGYGGIRSYAVRRALTDQGASSSASATCCSTPRDAPSSLSGSASGGVQPPDTYRRTRRAVQQQLPPERWAADGCWCWGRGGCSTHAQHTHQTRTLVRTTRLPCLAGAGRGHVHPSDIARVCGRPLCPTIVPVRAGRRAGVRCPSLGPAPTAAHGWRRTPSQLPPPPSQQGPALTCSCHR